MGKNKKHNSAGIILYIKILSPVFFILFVLAANIYEGKRYKEGTFAILHNDEYIESFVADVENAKESITCALFMFKLDDYNKDDLNEPIPLITSALVNASSKGRKVTIIFEKSKYDDDLSNKYNTKTAEYLESKGIKVLYDDINTKLHAKLCLIDDNIIYTGSHNFTYSAMKKNNESSVRIISSKDALDIKKYFDKIQ